MKITEEFLTAFGEAMKKLAETKHPEYTTDDISYSGVLIDEDGYVQHFFEYCGDNDIDICYTAKESINIEELNTTIENILNVSTSTTAFQHSKMEEEKEAS